jgi:phosphoheptose isomerase
MNLNIALISEHASPLATSGGVDSGGQNVYVAQVARHLASLGHRVDVFTRRDSESQPEIVKMGGGVRVIHVPAGPPAYVRKEDLLPHMAEFTRWVVEFSRRRRRYDIVHANFWMSGMTACELKRTLGIPFVITFHALGKLRRKYHGAADEFPDERFAIEEQITAEADAIIAECPQDEEDLVQLYNADPRLTTIVPCGVDTSEFHPIAKAIARQALGFAPDEQIVLQLGRIVPRKGLDNAIEGFALLRQLHGVDSRLVIVGGDEHDQDPRVREEVARLRVLAREKDVAEHVSFVGHRFGEDLRLYYSAADVFVTTPWYEPFGITPLESMACGTPVVGSNVGGIKFTVRDGETGYLVEPHNPGALAERLAHLYQNPRLRSLIGAKAVNRVNDLFTWDRVANTLINLYQDILARTQPVAAAEHSALRSVEAGLEAGIDALIQTKRQQMGAILRAADTISGALGQGNKLLLCGNGGSAAEAQHFACELMGRFVLPGRRSLPALALTTDSSFLTAWSNDVSFEQVYSRQVEALGEPGDVLVALSTSGRSPNILRAVETARRRGVTSIAITGGNGGELRHLADFAVVVPARDTQRIQEVHSVIVHLICQLIEDEIGRTASAGEIPEDLSVLELRAS